MCVQCRACWGALACACSPDLDLESRCRARKFYSMPACVRVCAGMHILSRGWAAVSVCVCGDDATASSSHCVDAHTSPASTRARAHNDADDDAAGDDGDDDERN